MKILVVAPSWIGDAVLAQPLLARLKRQHADARIEVLASAWSAPLLARMVEVDAVITSPFAHGEFKFWARFALGRQIRHEAGGQAFTHVYVLTNSWKSALVPFFAGIPQRIGYQGEARFGLLNQRHVLDKIAHPQLVQRYAALAGALSASEAALLRPVLQSDPGQQVAARMALGLPLDAAPVMFCPGAEYGPAKRWPTWHFASLARRIVSADKPVWLLGSARDVALGEQIVRASDGAALNLCGKTTLDQAIDLLAAARAVVTNDSGLMHVAAALGRPVVAIYGSSSPLYTPPLSPLASIVRQDLPCSPCFKRECPLGHLDCLNGLTPDTVLQYLAPFLAPEAAHDFP